MNKIYPLSVSETSVVKFLTQGYTKKEIATKIHRSEHTITEQTRCAYRKTNCRNLADITRWTIGKVYGLNYTEITLFIAGIILFSVVFSQLETATELLNKAFSFIKNFK